jgi:flavin reductase (DIM6/NTAB) family NADH-FMN oxidoreductase RutF
MRRVPAPVAVLATRAGHTVHAATVSSTTAVSRQPPLVSICLASESRTLALLREAGNFALTFLASGQGAAARRFADALRPDGAAQFATLAHHMTRFGPVLEHGSGWLGCRLDATYRAGDHEIVVGFVVDGGGGAGHPLLRHEGAFL